LYVMAQIGMIQVMQDMFKMEINKISDTEIEIVSIRKRYWKKEVLEEEKAILEKRLLEVNNLLKKFI